MRVFQKPSPKGGTETWKVRISGNNVIEEETGPRGREKESTWYLDPQNALDYLVGKRIEEGWKEVDEKAAGKAPSTPRIAALKPPPLSLPSLKVDGKTFPRIDRAIARARAFVAAWPQCQAILEDLPPSTDLLRRCADVEEDTKGFLRIHRNHLGRWHRKAKASQTKAVKGEGSPSYRYFCARYGSLTWVSPLDADRVGFLIGNVTGEGWGILQLFDPDETPLMEELIPDDRIAEDYDGHGLDSAIVFHGGWGNDGWVFDTRRKSKSGDWPIVRFNIDEPVSGLPHESRLSRAKQTIVPFDVWLDKEVDRCIRALKPSARQECKDSS